MLSIPEQSRQGFAFIFENEDLEPFTPTTVRFRVHDPETALELLAWIDLSPDSTVNVVIPATVNRIVDDSKAYEMRIVTVQSDHDTPNQLSQQREYRVENLSGFQS
jgi:hypothetical protein